MSTLPKHNQFRPDFMATGPYVEIEKKEGISFKDIRASDEVDEDMPAHRFYESDKVLGKLYRAIDESKVFEEMRGNTRFTRKDNPRDISVLEKILRIVLQEIPRATNINWLNHREWAMDIREA